MLHVLPPQHGCPGPPHATQLPAWHTLPIAHMLPGQQAVPAMPHATHWFCAVHTWLLPQLTPGPTQRWLLESQHEALHIWLAQHGWVRPPQPAHLPLFRQASPVEQSELAAMHTRALLTVSQQPALHTSPGQQAVPGMPQATHTLLVQVVPLAVQVLAPQQGWPGPPQATQVLLAHTEPPAEHWPPQQG